MKKKIYSAWLVVLALLLTALPAFAAAMQDPAQPITRQEFCNETYRLLQQADSLPQLAGDVQYADTTDQGVLALTELGLVEGIGQGYFAPDRGLTREEGAVILDRLYAFLLTEATPETGDAATGLAAAATGTAAAGAEPVNAATAQTADTAAVSTGNDIFSDSQAISSWAKDSVYRLSQLGILRGTTETAFSPQQPLTYEQGTALLLRLQDLCLPTAITSLSYQAALAEICATPRWIGTVGEQQAVSKIAQRFTEYGYQVELQSFPFAETNNLKGVQVSNHATNVIAVKQPADGKGNGDILIVSAHHDSMPSTVGANDNGSGTALLFELAKAVAADGYGYGDSLHFL